MRAVSNRSAIAVLRVTFLILASGGAAAAQPVKPIRVTAPSRVQGPIPASRVWHAAAAGKAAPVDERGLSMLVLQGLNIPDRVELTPRGASGGFSAEDLDRAAHILRDRAGNEHPVDPRLLDTVYQLQTHFGAPEIRIISGYRTPRGTSTSNHGKGRAMDLVVPSASDEDVAKFAREGGFAGVGIYPVSGFVHVDVREHSYFWVDTSGPGKRSRIRGVLSDLAAKSDARAVARGARGVGPFHIGTDVDAALGTAAAAAHASSPATVSAPDEEDEGEPSAVP